MSGATPDTLIQIQAENALKSLFSRLEKLEGNDYFRPSYGLGTVADPPEINQVNNLVGSVAAYNGNTIALARDNTANNSWLLFGDGNSWHWTLIHKDSLTVGLSVKAYRSTSLNIPNITPTTIQFPLSVYNNRGLHNGSINNTRLTSNATGLYSVKGNVRWASNSSGTFRRLQITKMGSIVASVSQEPMSVEMDMAVSVDIQLSVGQYVELSVSQNSGGALALTPGENFLPHFSMSRIH